MRLPATRIATCIATSFLLACAGTAHAADEPTGLDPAGACSAVVAGEQLLALADPSTRTRPDRRDLEDQAPTTIMSPDVFDVRRELAPGDSFTCTLTIRNRRGVRTTYDIEPVGLRARRGGGTTYVGVDDEGAASTAATWIDPVESSITLAANQIGEVPVIVTVPPDPPRGSAYGSVLVLPRVGTSPAGGDAAVGVRSGAGVPLLLRVGGTGSPKLTFRDVRAPLVRTDRAAWTWRARLHDDGTQHAIPRGRLRVRSILGRTVATMPIDARILLPGGSEPLAVTWKDTPWFGIYRYDVRVDPHGSDSGTSARASGWIIALPPWWIVAVALLIVAAAIAAPFIHRRREWRAYLDDADVIARDPDEPVDDIERE